MVDHWAAQPVTQSFVGGLTERILRRQGKANDGITSIKSAQIEGVPSRVFRGMIVSPHRAMMEPFQEMPLGPSNRWAYPMTDPAGKGV